MIESSQSGKSPSAARQLGRGALFITGAKLWFVASGALLLFALPRLGTGSDAQKAATFGRYQVVMAVLNPLTMMLILGTIQAISKFVSEAPARYPALLRRALKAQLVFGGLLALAFALCAPLVADLLDDESLVSALQVGSLVIFCYALYAALVGGVNGLKRFHVQAGLDVGFSSLKVGLILAAIGLGYGVVGAMSAFALTAALLLLLAFFLSRKQWSAPKPWQDDVDVKRLLAFQVWIILYALASNLLMNVDLYLVKAVLPDATAVGIYAACVQVARLPYVAVISVTFVLFPVISKALYAGDLDGARRGMFTACRYALLLIGPVALTLAALSADVLRLVFPSLYVSGATQLTALTLAYVGFAFLSIFTTILSSAGQPQRATLFMVMSLVQSAAAAWVGVSSFGAQGAAFGVAVAMGTGAFVVGFYLRSRYGARFPWATLGRLILVSLPIFVLGELWEPAGKFMIVIKGALFFSAFWAALGLLREFTPEDKQRFLQVLGRGSAPQSRDSSAK